MAIQLGSAYGKVSLDISGFKDGLSKGVQGLKDFESKAKAIGGTLQKTGVLMTAGLTLPIVGFFKSSVDSAIQAENAMAELNAVLKSTGNVAGLTADEITKMASELQKVTKFADDDIVAGQSMLLTFTKIGKDVFPMATEAMLNMAEKFGSIDQASIQLGKALNDPIAGVSALRRVGVMLTDEQEQQIKAFMAVNDIASAQKVILKELEVEFGGLAKAAGETTAGKIAQLNNAFDDLKEVVGAAIIPSLLKVVAGLTKMVEAFKNLPPFVQKGILVMLALVALVGPMLAFVGTVISALGSIAGLATTLGGLGISIAGIGPALATVGAVITGTLVPAVGALITTIGALLIELAPVILVIAAIAALIYLLYLAWKNNFLGIQDIVRSFIERLQGVRAAFDNIRDGSIKLYEDGSGALHDLAVAFGFPKKAMQELLARVYLIISAVKNIRDGAIKLYEDGSGALHDLAVAFGFPEKAAQEFLAKIYLIFDRFRDVFIKARENIINAFTKTDWGQVGKYILLGLANGMLLGIPSLIIAATKAAEAVLATIKKKLGIHSRSTVFEQLGIFSGQGYQYGLARAMNSEDLARIIAKPVQNLSNSQQQTIINNFSSGLTMRQVQAMIDDNGERLVERLNFAIGGA